MTDAGYESVAKHCRLLQELRMYACSGITDRTLLALGKHLGNLRVVDICGANSVRGDPQASARQARSMVCPSKANGLGFRVPHRPPWKVANSVFHVYSSCDSQ